MDDFDFDDMDDDDFEFGYDDFMEDVEDAAFWQEPDFLLTNLVATLVNMSGIPLGVTLFTKGMVISGVLTSEREYLTTLTHVFQEMAKDSLPHLNEDELDQVSNALDFRMLTEGPPITDTSNGFEDEGDYDPGAPIRYLHLKDVVVVSPQPSLAFGHGVLPIMRLRLNQVDGWVLGQATGLDEMDEENGPDIDEPPILH
jgi:hypothetical protein